MAKKPPAATAPQSMIIDTPEEILRKKIQDEIKEFKCERSIDYTKESALKWWKLNARKYPKLAAAARRLLAIPATSAPCERLFSQASLTVSDHRANLSCNLVQSLVLLKSWYNYRKRNTSTSAKG